MTNLATQNRVRVLVAMALTLVTQGCHPAALERVEKPADAATKNENVPAPVSIAVPYHADTLYGLDGLKASCLKTPKVYWSDKTSECVCLFQLNETPLVFTTADGGACVPLQHKKPNGRSAVEAYMNGWTPELNKHLEGLVRSKRTSLGIELSSSVTGQEALHIARYVDNLLPNTYAKLWVTPEQLYFNSSVKIIVGRAKVGRDFIEQVVEPPPVTSQQSYKLTLVEPEAAKLLHSLGHPNSEVGVLAPIPDTLSSQHATGAFIQTLFSKTDAQPTDSTRVKVGGDCRRYCVVEQELAEDVQLDVKAVRNSWYMAGVVFRDVITIRHQTTLEPQAFIQLGLSGEVSAILFVSRFVEARSDSAISHVEVYDRLWNKIGEEQFTLLPGISRKSDLASKIPPFFSATRNSVVMCESIDLEAFDRAGILDSLRRRPSPFDSQEARGSFLGWLSNPLGEFRRFLDPLIEFNGVVGSADAATHGYRVARTLLSSNESIAIIPISAPNCMARYQYWQPVAQQKGVKVVNFSATEPVDRRWCEEFHSTKSFLGQGKPFLWVTAAGNAGLENPALRCPQAIGPAENLVVVARGNSGGLWHQSDYGKFYADIAADVHSSASADVGTSYSAARVSAAAANIASLFATLTPRELRLALLLGAEVPHTPLPVRSGGVLNEADAIKVASVLTESTYLEKPLTEEKIQRILETFLSKQEADRRFQIWKERNNEIQ
jgi:hypothetical protein